jgi:phytanoyl-CoA hydroxylase
MSEATQALAQGHSSTQDAKAYYDEQGYVVFEKLIPERLIDRLMSLYARDIHASKAKFYRQNTNVYDSNRLTEHGHVIQSFLDVHHYKRFPEFRQAALDLYFSPEILQALSQVTGHEHHNLMQSMLFDANAATPPHQDWWYLDTVPNGNLLGAWIALEDIHEDAGRFYVMPGTQHLRMDEPNLPHSEWLVRMREFLSLNPHRVKVPALRKGDVLFWNSRTIHGALETRDRRHSRKSLTAHFMPSTMTFGNLFTSKPWVQYESHGEHRYFANQPEHSFKADLVSRLKVAVYDSPRLMKLVRKVQNRSVADA